MEGLLQLDSMFIIIMDFPETELWQMKKRNCNDPPSSPLVNDFNLVEVTQDPSLQPAQTPRAVDPAVGTVRDRLPHHLGHQGSHRCP